MLDIKFLRDNPEKVEQALQNRGAAMSLDEFLGREKERRELLAEVEVLKNKRNTVSQEISKKKKAGENADDMIFEMREVGDRIGVIDTRVKETEAALAAILMNIPNVPHQSVPVGKDEQDNPEIRRWGRRASLPLNPNHTGKSAKSWVFSILNGVAK